MFSGLRLRLTVLYLLAGATLIALIGGGMYLLVRRYFVSTTDHALEHRMAFEFAQLRAPLPPELRSAELEVVSLSEDAQNRAGLELAEIFVLPLDEQGRALFNPNPFPPPIEADAEAARQALAAGKDWRTLDLPNGSRVRLLSYRLTRDDGPRVMQAGRMLDEQDAALSRLLLALLALGAGSLVLLGWGSWWMAGRSLVPAQRAWERQQAFVANASHELRAPLTLLRASAEVALRGTPAGEEDQRELLGDVLHECDHMTRLVEDLLLLSRLDAGQLQLERAPIAAGELLDEVARQIGRVAAERGVALDIDA
ncbi:MAG TPA: HAMP domain-containing sensor histidine kinase, partial [Herpetosiphonaceae bacterium]